jgi:hypothetical protein
VAGRGCMATFAPWIGVVRGLACVPMTCAVADDLAHWRAAIPGTVVAAAAALLGPTTPPGACVQLLNPPGSAIGPGQICTWGKATAPHMEVQGFHGDWAGTSRKLLPCEGRGPT